MKILALDISKTSTGAIVTDIDFTTGRISNIEVHTISPKKKIYTDKSQAINLDFYGCNQIIEGITQLCKDKKIDFCIFEFPITGTYKTEVAFYMCQMALTTLFNLGIDTLGIVPIRLKSYIKDFYNRATGEEFKVKKKNVDKKEIELIYNTLQIQGKLDHFPIHKIKNDDERDAFFLTQFLYENMNKEYLSNNKTGYSIKDMLYKPIIDTTYNSGKKAFCKGGDFFTFKDKKFYPFKYFKVINLV